MNDLASQFRAGLGQAWATLVVFVPKLLLFIAVLVVGYFVAKGLCKLLNLVLERVGFDRLVERGGIKRMLERTHWDASDVLSTIVFYFVMLFTLQAAFGMFGPNPISDLLAIFVAYLPNVFVAALIIIVAGAIASGVKQVIWAAIGGLNYGRWVSNGAAVAIWAVGLFAALNQLRIAPAIVNGLFYALLAVVVGSAIVAIGGGGIAPMRVQWERMLGKVQREAPRVAAEAGATPGAPRPTAEHPVEETPPHEAPRFRTTYPSGS